MEGGGGMAQVNLEVGGGVIGGGGGLGRIFLTRPGGMVRQIFLKKLFNSQN